MSATFAPSYEDSDVLGYRYICAADESVVVEEMGSEPISFFRARARAVATRHLDKCEECSYYGYPLFEIITETPLLNVSNSNSFYLQELLGLDPEECGSLGAEDFLGRVLVARGLNPADEGVPWTSDLEKPNFIYCGRRPGYSDDRLVELEKIARWALEHGREVAWA